MDRTAGADNASGLGLLGTANVSELMVAHSCDTQYSTDRSDNIPFYHPDCCHCGDVVYSRGREGESQKWVERIGQHVSGVLIGLWLCVCLHSCDKVVYYGSAQHQARLT